MSRLIAGLHPTRVILITFLFALIIGTATLMVPGATHADGGASFMEALFTAVSALCVTGLTTVDTATHWTTMGKVIILALVKVGGFGVMTLASLIGYSVLGKISLQARITAATEVKAEGLEDVRQLILSVLRISLTVESVVATILALRFWHGYEMSPAKALWYGIFHSVTAFNNAGFALFSDSLIRFVADPWICLPIAAAIILGGIGFPVITQLRRYARDPLRWSMNTRLVLAGTLALLVFGTIYITVLESTNPQTIGNLPWYQKLLAGFFQSVQTRTAGFNSIDMSRVHEVTLIGMDFLMFVGGGPAGTAGGIKITTFLVLWYVSWTEVRGEATVTIFHKRLPGAIQRQATAVALLSTGLIGAATAILVLVTPYSLDECLFEAVSAFATVGLSTGITPSLGVLPQFILCFLMLVGRLGPITFASALALRRRKRLYEFPRERPIIG